ncbi:MAG: hypothetical protein A2275_10245 [Bacteroidetes bacterium RIFOXYA12_FULL_35_11]|nr:MAG: hypothetical protein A2X01_10620 [Bacteroidetes bacterium GWF2_35_48]OFY74672.1 MAG: hypothetical protein A2275_10245 [Bacteroidetes bacterium RIFOXYA12_FULL_35_11]OFY95888.1 MAG: hypothetical protein A2491_21495 [Bacteroidetes bacterium RIFOXYC12_FULL_35_7]HBX49897.1 hypothetical protein [Bacteroidales bacterium]
MFSETYSKIEACKFYDKIPPFYLPQMQRSVILSLQQSILVTVFVCGKPLKMSNNQNNEKIIKWNLLKFYI